jgi:hypothetical protein
MYNIQNISNFTIPMRVEKGGIILMPGQYFDLDKVCSRKFIGQSSELNKYMESQSIRLVHDSEIALPSTTIRSPALVIEALRGIEHELIEQIAAEATKVVKEESKDIPELVVDIGALDTTPIEIIDPIEKKLKELNNV